MARNRHGHSFRDAGAHHVANCAAPKIVEEPLADLGCLAGGFPRFVETFDLVGSIRVQEDEGQDGPRLSPELLLPQKDLQHFIIHGHGSGLVIFGLTGVEPHHPLIEIDFIPCQPRDLTEAPAGLIRKRDEALQVTGHGIAQLQEVAVFEKSFAHVVFLKHGDERHTVHLRRGLPSAQIKHTLQGGQLPIDAGVCSFLLSALLDVFLDGGSGDVGDSSPFEEGLQVLNAAFGPNEGPFPIDSVISQEALGEFIEPYPVEIYPGNFPSEISPSRFLRSRFASASLMLLVDSR